MVLLLLATSLTAADFESASAILRAKCLSCHSAGVRSAGLSVESRDDILRGGKSGSAIVPGNPVDSMLMIMIATAKMPMGGAKLSDAEIATIRKWIEGENKKPPVAERDVQAVLSAKCWVCHGRRQKQAGLDLRSRDSLLKGGKSGPAIVAGSPDDSLLVKRIAAREMPPPHLQEQFSVRGLTEDEFEKVKQWIADGARPDAEESIEVNAGNDPSIKPKDREFWAFQSPRRPPIPAVKGRVLNPIDAFVLEKLEARGASLMPQASPAALLRRAYFDLTGLPPSPEEIGDYLQDPDPNRYTKLIERLLRSPSYGERWGRHWLDAVGYADSEGGNNEDTTRKEAWRYRDYVIKAFNSNKPFDKFLTEQIAGDELFDYGNVKELTGEQLQQLAATGFWRMAPDGTNSTEQNFIPERMDVIAGQLEIFGSAVMGLTLGCARCHDHKSDPIPTRDYYRLVAILTPAYDPYHWLPGEFPCDGVGAKCDENNTRFIIAKATAEYSETLAHNEPIDARIKQLEQELEEKAKPYRAKYMAENKGAEAKLNELAEAYEAFRKEKTAIEEQLRKLRNSRKRPPLIRALFDLGPEPPPTRILMRGDAASPGALVTPGVLSVLSANLKQYRVEPLAHSTGRRLALAKWLTQPDHPLTARVMVNRIWQGHFGTGLVATPGNFGRTGSPPENQPLLDWLATEFVRSGWDIKAMHRLIMTSAVYQQQSGPNGFPLRRLDAESIRDSILKIAGRLDTRQFGAPDAIKEMPDGEVTTESRRRSIYVSHRRTQPLSLLESFDMPFMNPNCVQRGKSVVSSQSLHLMNSDLVRENSRFMAGRIIDAAGENTAAQIERAYLLALGRKPSEDERNAAATALERMTAEWRKQLERDKPEEPIQNRARWLALSTFCHTLINSAEFLYIE